MRKTKIVLIFQAIITLIIGLVFLSQILTINSFRENENTKSPLPTETQHKITDIKTRYTAASYILVLVALIELIIIIKLIT